MIDRFRSANNLLEALLSQRCVRGNQVIADALAAKVQVRELKAHEILIEQGGEDNDVYFILAGSLDIVVNGRSLATRGAGEHVGEMVAILPSLRRSASVKATETTIVAQLTADDLIGVADSHPAIWRHFASTLAERLLQRNRLVSTASDRIRVFVISSAEALPIARAVQEIFAHDPFRVTIWVDGIFRASNYSIESLLQVLDVSDFAVAIVQPDDLIHTRGATEAAPRDNVLFELGLFIGRLGRLRSFLLQPMAARVKLPSDLSGITTIPYRAGPESELLTNLAPACNHLRRLFQELGPQ